MTDELLLATREEILNKVERKTISGLEPQEEPIPYTWTTQDIHEGARKIIREYFKY